MSKGGTYATLLCDCEANQKQTTDLFFLFTIMSEIGIPPVLQSLSTLVDQKPQSYVRGNEDVRSAALAAAQYIFDLCTFAIHSVIPVLNLSYSCPSRKSISQTYKCSAPISQSLGCARNAFSES